MQAGARALCPWLRPRRSCIAPGRRARTRRRSKWRCPPDGSRLYVVCEGYRRSGGISTPQRGTVLRRSPRRACIRKALALSADGSRLYVANSWSDSVSEIDAASLKSCALCPPGSSRTPRSRTARGRFLYVANRIGNDISVIDLATGVGSQAAAGRARRSYLALSPDGTRHLLHAHLSAAREVSRCRPNRKSRSSIHARQIVVDREPLRQRRRSLSRRHRPSDGRLGIAAQLRPKNLIPLAHVEHGWVFGNSLSVFGEEIGEAVQLPLDELDRYFTPPFAVAISPDKSAALSSAPPVGQRDRDRRRPGCWRSPRGRTPASAALANDLSASANYVAARIPVGRGAQGAGAVAGREAALRGQPDGRHHLGGRHRRRAK